MSNQKIDWNGLQKELKAALTPPRLRRLAADWCVPASVLQRLGCGWSDRHHAYTFPERDHRGRIIGIVWRNAKTGAKRMISGSTRGAYWVKGLQETTGPILVPEGVSDTAVLLAHGIAVVGRPSCSGGVNVLAELLSPMKRDVIVVGENDEKNGQWPGKAGAEKTAQQLADLIDREVKWTLPPDGIKDVREWFARGGQHGH